MTLNGKRRMRAVWLLACSAALMCFGCSDKQLKEPIAFTDTISLMPDEQWAVVTAPYIAFQASPGENGTQSVHARRGDVLHITGFRYVGGTGGSSRSVLWYGFEQGWLPETAVAVYANRFRAGTAANELP